MTGLTGKKLPTDAEKPPTGIRQPLAAFPGICGKIPRSGQLPASAANFISVSFRVFRVFRGQK